MKVHLKQIHPEGLELNETFACEQIGLTRQDSIRLVAPVKVVAHIQRAEDELIASIKASSRYESFCFRCLEDISRDWVGEFTLVVDIDKYTELVDLDEDIRQELILNLPARILCHDECKGLCTECGVDLNNKACNCVLSGQRSAVSGQGKVKNFK